MGCHLGFGVQDRRAKIDAIPLRASAALCREAVAHCAGSRPHISPLDAVILSSTPGPTPPTARAGKLEGRRERAFQLNSALVDLRGPGPGWYPDRRPGGVCR